MVTINQPASIGDILFIEPICKYFFDKEGEKPKLPVKDHLMWIAPYINSANIVPLSSSGMDSDNPSSLDHTFTVDIPLRFANQIFRGYSLHDHHDFEEMMLDKYRLVNIDPMLWKTLNVKFNEDKCNRLLEELTGGGEWDDYILVNNNSQAGTIDIQPETNLPIIRMHERPGYTVLDWAFVMLHAQENHHVSTSTFHIMQALVNKYKFNGKVVIYPRPNSDGLRGISKLNPDFKYEIGS